MTASDNNSLVHFSAAEYLILIASTGGGRVDATYADENIWLTQNMMVVLYNVEANNINYHLKDIFSDSKLIEDAVVRNFRITANDGKNYNTKHYNISAIVARSYKANQ